MKRLFALATTVLCLPILLVGSVFAYLLLKISRLFGARAAESACSFVGYYIGRTAVFSTLSNVEVHGLEKLESAKPVVIYSNHASFSDIPILSGFVMPSALYVARKGLAMSPIITAAGGVLIEQKSSKKELKNIREIVAKIKAGRSFIIFPEGTRCRDGKVGELKAGSIKIAKWAGVPAVPVRIEGSRRLLPRGAFLPRPARVEVFIGDPISAEDETKALSDLRTFFEGKSFNNLLKS